MGSYTGRHHEPGLVELEGVRVNPKYPPEDPDEGCPGGWRLSPYTSSIAPYLRSRADGGARVPNPLLDRCDDDTIIQAVLYYEREHERCIAHTMTVEEKARKDG